MVDEFNKWKSEKIPTFLEKAIILCITQDIEIGNDSVFHYLGFFPKLKSTTINFLISTRSLPL